MLSTFLDRCANGETVTVRNIAVAELRVVIGSKTYFIPANGKVTLTELGTHTEVSNSVEVRDLIRRGYLILV